MNLGFVLETYLQNNCRTPRRLVLFSKAFNEIRKNKLSTSPDFFAFIVGQPFVYRPLSVQNDTEVNPIMMKVYQAAGGGGMPEGQLKAEN